MSGRFFYHSFPRRGETLEKGLSILESIVASGLLLVPEITTWPGEIRGQDGGELSPPIFSVSKRICFTHILPTELAQHAETFGEFAVEFDDSNLRALGATPVFYVPVSDKSEELQAMPVHFLHRLQAVQEYLERALAFHAVFKAAPPESQVVAAPDGEGGMVITSVGAPGSVRLPKAFLDTVRLNGKDPVAVPSAPLTIGAQASALNAIFNVLEWGITTLQVQLNGIRSMCGLFYPCERTPTNPTLEYYQQREWRVLSGMERFGVQISRHLVNAEVDRLLAIDREFFERQLKFPTGMKRRVDQCHYISELNGRHVLTYARRVIVPRDAMRAARQLLNHGGLQRVKLRALEAVAPPQQTRRNRRARRGQH